MCPKSVKGLEMKITETNRASSLCILWLIHCDFPECHQEGEHREKSELTTEPANEHEVITWEAFGHSYTEELSFESKGLAVGFCAEHKIAENLKILGISLGASVLQRNDIPKYADGGHKGKASILFSLSGCVVNLPSY